MTHHKVIGYSYALGNGWREKCARAMAGDAGSAQASRSGVPTRDLAKWRIPELLTLQQLLDINDQRSARNDEQVGHSRLRVRGVDRQTPVGVLARQEKTMKPKAITPAQRVLHRTRIER